MRIRKFSAAVVSAAVIVSGLAAPAFAEEKAPETTTKPATEGSSLDTLKDKLGSSKDAKGENGSSLDTLKDKLGSSKAKKGDGTTEDGTEKPQNESSVNLSSNNDADGKGQTTKIVGLVALIAALGAVFAWVQGMIPGVPSPIAPR